MKFQPCIVNEVFVPLNDVPTPDRDPMGAAETKAGHEDEHVDGTSAAPWPQLDGVRPKTSPALDDRRSEDGGGRGGAKSNTLNAKFFPNAICYYSDSNKSAKMKERMYKNHKPIEEGACIN